MQTVDFPLERAGADRSQMDLQRLARLLRESALLLEAAQVSSNDDFRAGSVDLALRTMRAAGVAIDRLGTPRSTSRSAQVERVVAGPWAGSAEPAVILPEGR